MKKITVLIFIFLVTNIFAQDLSITLFAYGFNTPVEITNAGDNRLFVVEQTGSIKVVNADGSVNPENFLTMPPNTVLIGAERGLLGLVFDPQYATNGYFYIYYTRDPDGKIIVERHSVDPQNPNIALQGNTMQIISIDHPESSHNGGTLRFGPDGYLYIGVGDGWDPLTNAQDINLNLGKLLRIDVSHSTESEPYSIPPGNPFVGIEGNDEIWALGLRNPWKYSFDHETGDLWIADVGSNTYEEIDHMPSTTPGLNYGWICYEANTLVFECGPIENYTFPMANYVHTPNRCSIIGGYVYRGTEYPNLHNKYIFSDLCANAVLMADINTGEITSSAVFPGDSEFFTTLGQDINGELYIASSSDGVIHKIVDNSLQTKDFSQVTLSLAPNPAVSEFQVRLSRSTFPLQVSIMDATGKKLSETRITSESTPVNVQQLQSGIYLVHVTDNTGASATTKLAVTR